MSDTVLELRLPSPATRPGGDELFRQGLRCATGQGGDGVDRVSAHALFDLAARFGSLEAKVYRREIADEMDPAEVAESQAAAREWLARA